MKTLLLSHIGRLGFSPPFPSLLPNPPLHFAPGKLITYPGIFFVAIFSLPSYIFSPAIIYVVTKTNTGEIAGKFFLKNF